MNTINLSLTKEQLSAINAALMELPYRISAPLIQDINMQIQRQFDLAKGDNPTGQIKPKDEFAGD
jgi:hypothetical protein